MAKSERRACPGCGTWRCSNCGHTQQSINRFAGEPVMCTRCPGNQAWVGVMLPVFHRIRAKYDDHLEQVQIAVRGSFYVRYPLIGFDYLRGAWDDEPVQSSPE